VVDLLNIITFWGQTSPPEDDPLPADINWDYVVDVEDLLIVMGNWGDC